MAKSPDPAGFQKPTNKSELQALKQLIADDLMPTIVLLEEAIETLPYSSDSELCYSHTQLARSQLQAVVTQLDIATLHAERAKRTP